ncbi:hypothetical protein V6N13_038316 [Hibiscus sabdariffa]|uniref:Steroid 5-alpha reductase C-terminal domain-containing protein n=1 Tax=Hibiscus sabdariffa TaxID=183260 RepID=A0ABR2S2H8_9ROSI
MKVSLVSRSGREFIKGGLELNDSATVADLQEAIHKRTKKFYPSRQRLTLPVPSGSRERPVVLNYKKSLKDYCDGNENSLTVVFKDLGPQVSYRTLFFFEYLGPLILYPVFYYFPVYKFFGYKGDVHPVHPVQTYALYYWCFHYFKRIMETFFVHRFSHATSPLSNVFRNCAYYWTFGAYIAYYVNHPLYTPVGDLQMKIGFGFGLVCQLANFYCHIILKNLRGPDGSGGYQIPRGFLFNIVTCANYTTEIYQWLGFNIATQTVAGYVFLVVATSIMTNWALAKHRRLKKLFDADDSSSPVSASPPLLPPLFSSSAATVVITMDSEDWESCSDNEIYLEDKNEDDDEEDCYSSGSVSSLQFRKDISKARWIDDLAMAEVVEKKGKMWVTMGIVRNGNTYCSIEETLFLVEIGALHVLYGNGIHLSLKELYEKLSDGKSGCDWELFEVYRHLKALGYVVGRHGIPWSVKGQKIKSGTCSLESSQESNELLETEQENKNSIVVLFNNMQITEVILAFHVYLPNSKFRKSSPGDPSFILCMSRGGPPSRVEIEAVERKHGAIPLKFCHVENGRVSFFSFDKVELPVLP